MQHGENISKDSIFALGSTSKAITATAMLKVLKDHGIGINTPIVKYLSDRNSENSITISDLLNHTSGISTYETIDNLKYLGNYGEFEYSNANYHLLGELIESVTGKSYSDFVEKEIFSKLKMTNSFALTDNKNNHIVQGYQSIFGVVIPKHTMVPNEKSWIQAPSGLISSSSADMSAYLRYALDFSYENQSLHDIVKNTGTFVKSSPAIEGVYGKRGVYGAGWILKKVNGTDILYHTGKLSNFSSLSVIIPDKGIGVTVLCNVGDFFVGTNQIEKMYEGIISILLASEGIPIIPKYTYLKTHIVMKRV